MATRIYTGFAPRGSVTIGGRTVSFVRGEPVEVSAEEAALLGDEWTAPKARKAKATKAKATKADTQPDTSEEEKAS